MTAALSPATGPAPPADEPAALPRTRRIDWRFLLPRPELGRVAVTGRPDHDLLDAIDRDPTAVHPVPAGAPADLLVAVSPSVAQLRAGLAGAAPDAVAYLEVLGHRARWRARRVLRQEGWRELAVHLQWPGAGRATAFVPSGDPAGQRRAAATRTGREAPLLRALATRGWLGAVSRSASVVAVAPAWAGATTPLITAGIPTEAEPVLLLTPRHAASRHVVALSGDVVVKCPRLPGDDAELRNEQAVLARLDAAGAVDGRPRLVPTAPAPVRRLVETRLEGALVTRADAARHPDRVLADIVAWLAQLHVGPASTPAGDGRLERLVRTPLLEVAGRLTDAALIAELHATLDVAATLGGHAVPVVFEHGDVRPPNLLRTAGGLAVIDWELAEPDGFPLHDLLYAVDFVTAAAAGARRPLAVAPHDVAARALAELGVDDTLRPGLTVVSWARRAASLALRSAAGPDRPIDAAWWAGTHPVRRWRDALGHLDGRSG